jgi:CRP-like cAMP-binding protein
MSLLEAEFIITAANDCPMYEVDDVFSLSGLALTFPHEKPTCLFLTKEITEILVSGKLDSKDESQEKREYNCSGCRGVVKFRVAEERKYQTQQMRMLAAAESKEQKRSLGPLENMLNTFSFLQVLDEESMKVIMEYLSMHNYIADEIVLQEGNPGKNLYMIVSGRVAVLDDKNEAIAFLGRGEIFGEMSLFTGKPVCATIKTVEPTMVFYLSGKDLSNIIMKFPYLQMAVTQILAQRLGESNVSQGQTVDKSLGLSGQLSELPPSELFQMINENMKTGRVEMQLSGGAAIVAFKEGEIVRAQYKEKEGRDAFFAILVEKVGSFSFKTEITSDEMRAQPIDAFMKLLMDGLRLIDEEK